MNVYGGVELEPVNVMFGCAPFSQIGTPPPAMVAIGSVVTLINIFAIVAQVAGAADVGVNVYCILPAEAALIVAGDQDPAIPLLEVSGRVPGIPLTQYGPSWIKTGIVVGLTVRLKFATHPTLLVYVTTTDPAVTLLTTPALVMVAIATFELVQGLETAGVGLPVSVVLVPAQRALLPVTIGSALTVIVEVIEQLLLLV